MKRLAGMGFGENISEWLEGEGMHSFFEFQCTSNISSTSGGTNGNQHLEDVEVNNFGV